MEKRKGYKFPEATIHSKIVIGLWEELGVVLYEHYDTWFLRSI